MENRKEARFEKKIKSYILKNKDIPVLSFDYEKTIDKSKFGLPLYKIKHIKILRKDLLPPGYPETIDSSKLEKWIKNRKIPRNRKNMENIINFRANELEIDNGSFMNYIEISYGLSLNDSYWILPKEKENLLWKDYNLYENKFSEIISLVAFGARLNELSDTYNRNIRTSPEYTTDGMLAKCWTVLDNEIHLLKKSTEKFQKEAYTEYYMCQIAELMGFEYINYDIIKYHNNVVCSCKLFTNENIGFIPMFYALGENQYKKGGKLLEAISKIYGEEKFEDLMVFDSLIYNKDRHLGNLGMLIDNNTLKILKAAPIFDNGTSILSFINEDTQIENIFKRYVSAFEIDFDILSNIFVKERHREGLERLKNFEFKRHNEFNLEENILKKAEDFIQKRAKLMINQLDKKLEKLISNKKERPTRSRSRINNRENSR